MREKYQVPILKCAVFMTYTENEHQRALILRTKSNEGILEKDFTTPVETKSTS